MHHIDGHPASYSSYCLHHKQSPRSPSPSRCRADHRHLTIRLHSSSFFWKSLADLRKPPNGQNPMLSYGPPVLRRGDSKLPASHAHSAMLEAAYLLSVEQRKGRLFGGSVAHCMRKGRGGGKRLCSDLFLLALLRFRRSPFMDFNKGSLEFSSSQSGMPRKPLLC